MTHLELFHFLFEHLPEYSFLYLIDSRCLYVYPLRENLVPQHPPRLFFNQSISYFLCNRFFFGR
jgi:hypothetical protein